MTETYAVLQVVDEKGEIVKTSVSSEDAAEKAVANDKTSRTSITAKQTFSVPEVKSLEEFVSLVSDSQVQVDMLNRAIKQKAQIRIYNLMQKDDFEPQAGTRDASELVSSPMERRVVSLDAKFEALLAGLPKEKREQLLLELLEKK